MKKKFNILKIITVSISFIFITFSLIYFNQNKIGYFDFAQSNDELKTISEKSLSLENINNINFDVNIDNIKFLQSNKNEIKIVEKSNKDFHEKININVNNNSLDIYREKVENLNANSFGDSFYRELIIYLPQNYKENVNINTYLGDINFNLDLNLKNIKINLSTGDINFNNSIKCNSLILEGVSGDFYINTLECDNYGISLNTGYINIDNLYGGGYVNSTHGDINLNLYSLTKNSHIYSSNGNINLNINKYFEFFINTYCDIGNIKNDFKYNKIGSAPVHILDIYGGSSNIKINKNY